ncbi:MAG: glycosyltransferase [Thiohalocapsa sp.]
MPLLADTSNRVRVAEVITGLERGGAEIMLLRLLGVLDRERFAPTVVSLRPPGPIAERIEALGIPVASVCMQGSVPSPTDLSRLWRQMRALGPDLVHTWMYHADLLGGLVGRLGCHAPVIWALRNSNLDPAQVKLSTRFTVRLNALLSAWIPDRIVSNSRVAIDLHRSIGYASDKLVLIPNGFDLAEFRSDAEAATAVRAELGLSPDTCLVGSFARFHPQKDHRTLCQAAGRIAARHERVHFLLAGDGIDHANPELAAWIAENGVADRFHLLGPRDDMPRLTGALDLALVTSSFGEAFPQVIGEAMACAVPCVVTDVGDAGFIVGDTGRLVPSRDPEALAGAVLELLDVGPADRAELGRRARLRIESDFSLEAVAGRYAALYSQVVADRRLSKN